MSGLRAQRLAARRAERRRAARRGAMAAAASVVAAVGTVTGLVSALDDDRAPDEARPRVTRSPSLRPLLPAPTTPTPSTSPPSLSPYPFPSPTSAKPSPEARGKAGGKKETAALAESGGLYLHPGSQVLDWVAANPTDPRISVIRSRIADRPAAVWFTHHTPSTITARVRAVTSGAAERGQVPVVVPYAIPDRDCGGASQGGARNLEAYDEWIDKFAAGLGSEEVIVILEPDSIAQSDCLSQRRRVERFASLARAGRILKAANPSARVYYDAGHSRGNAPDKQAALLGKAGAASAESSDGVFSNVSNFNRTSAEVTYTRQVLDGLGGPASLGAVIDTSRNGNGAPADGEWCDPAGRKLGQPPTLSTGEARIDAYLWVKMPGESDGCKGAAGRFSPGYAYDLAR